MVTTIPLFGPIPGGPELLIILLVLVLLFGANKIPKLARSTGQAMGEFKKGREEVEEELQEMQDDVTSTSETESTEPAAERTEPAAEPTDTTAGERRVDETDEAEEATERTE